LEKLQNQQATDFLALLKTTEAEVMGRLNSVSQMSAFQSYQLAQVLAEVKNGISSLESKASDLFSAAQQDAIDLSVQHTVDELTRLSSSLDDNVSLGVSLDAATGMSDPAQALLANQFESSVQGYGIDVLNRVRQRVQVGMLTGEPGSDVVASVGEAIGDTSYQAERLVRTETSNAYGASQHRAIADAAEQIPGLKKMWIHQSSYICKVCIKLDGTERPVNGTWTIQIGKKTKRIAHAPAHPNCTCRVTAMKPSWKKGLEKLGYLDNDEER
jgi:hypothetical protein